MSERRKMLIVDMTTEGAVATGTPIPTKANTPPLSEEFGRNLDSIPKARQWLSNPHNWHTSAMWIVRWNGLLVTVNEKHAIDLINSPNDNGLPEVIVREQFRLRQGGKHQDDPTPEEQ